jgi:hypothetical protein
VCVCVCVCVCACARTRACKQVVDGRRLGHTWTRECCYARHLTLVNVGFVDRKSFVAHAQKNDEFSPQILEVLLVFPFSLFARTRIGPSKPLFGEGVTREGVASECVASEGVVGEVVCGEQGPARGERVKADLHKNM